VTIKEGRYSAGRVLCVNHPAVDLRRKRTVRSRFYIEREIMIAFGGIAAEEVYTGKRDFAGADFDSSIVYALSGYKTGRREEAIAYGHWLYERTVTLLLLQKAALKALVSALLENEYLSGRVARDIFVLCQRRRR
jgi:ATP-dependent Zn protease